MTVDAPPDLAHADVGIVHATSMELAPFWERCDRVRTYNSGDFVFRGGKLGKTKVAAVQTGMGAEAARVGTQLLLDTHTPKSVVCAGFSGGLLDAHRVGDIVVANSLINGDRDEVRLNLGMSNDPARGLYVGRLLQVDRFVRLVSEKRTLASEFQAIALDMESYAVAVVCRDAKKPFMAVRVVSDDMKADLPAEVTSIVGSTGTVRWGATLGALWNRPGSITDLWRLREQANTAADRLAVFLDGVVEQLAQSVPG